MLPQTLLAWATMVMAAVAIPTNPKPTTSSGWPVATTTTKSATTAKSTSSAKTSPASSVKVTSTASKTTSASPTPTINNGNQALNKCLNFGISLLDCTELLNIAALNGNSISIGGPAKAGVTPVNNGNQFKNECANIGLSIADCAEVLNLAILNGNAVYISLADITALVAQLGISLSGVLGTILGGLGGILGGALFPIPANVL